VSAKKILVFGGAGFMATYLIDALARQHYEVTASDISEQSAGYFRDRGIPFVKVDITRREQFDLIPHAAFDAVIHLAATQPANLSKDNYSSEKYIDVNISGTVNILEFCRARQIRRVVYASSHRNTQGLWGHDRAITEDAGRAIKFDGEYAMFSITESAAQDCVTHYTAQYGLSGITFRLPPVYGFGPHTEIYKDGMPIKTGFQIFIDNAKAGKPIELWGDASKGRDIIYVKDVIDAYIKAIEQPDVTGLFNITSGTLLTLRQEAEAIIEVFAPPGVHIELIERPEKTNNIDNFLYDISKAKRELGWAPRYTFKEMLYDFEREAKNNTFGHLIENRRKNLTIGA
jgi:UDP-glucose 4-epimerase